MSVFMNQGFPRGNLKHEFTKRNQPLLHSITNYIKILTLNMSMFTPQKCEIQNLYFASKKNIVTSKRKT